MTTTVGDIMTPSPATVDETATVGEALELLSSLEVRHLPVMSDGELQGILSDRDLKGIGVDLEADPEGLERIKALLSAPVGKLMSGNVLSIDPSTDVSELIDLLLSEKVGAVPVVDEETSELVGIVSYVDVLRALRDQLD